MKDFMKIFRKKARTEPEAEAPREPSMIEVLEIGWMERRGIESMGVSLADAVSALKKHDGERFHGVCGEFIEVKGDDATFSYIYGDGIERTMFTWHINGDGSVETTSYRYDELDDGTVGCLRPYKGHIAADAVLYGDSRLRAFWDSPFNGEFCHWIPVRMVSKERFEALKAACTASI